MLLWPLHCGRQAGEDGIDVAAGLQPEDRAAVVEQVELGIAAAAHKLLLAVDVGPGVVEVLADELVVDRKERAADILHEGEVGIPATLFIGRMLPVEESAADTARLVAVGEEK